jgi:transposase
VIQITPQMRILLAVEPADFRRGIDGLARICRVELAADPFSGMVFVFRNRGATALKILVYDGQGYWLCQKRLSSGRFTWWPSRAEGKSLRLDVHEIQLLLWNGNPDQAGVSPPWRRILPKDQDGGVQVESPRGNRGLRSKEVIATLAP